MLHCRELSEVVVHCNEVHLLFAEVSLTEDVMLQGHKLLPHFCLKHLDQLLTVICVRTALSLQTSARRQVRALEQASETIHD
jgi:hypothetical protein